MKLILGCGLTGVSVAKYFAKKNIDFIVADTQLNPPLSNTLPKCLTFFGAWNKDILTGVSEIVISPGVSPDEDIVLWANQQNIKIISDIDLFYQDNKNKIFIGITGTNGKSTTTKLLEFVLQKMNLNAVACGNIGVPVLEVNADNDIFIMEISSYQLDYSQKLKLNYGLILNITPDHLSRYKTIENYTNSKLKIHKISDKIIVNRDNNLSNSNIGFTNKVPKNDDFGVLNCHGNKFVIFADNVILEYEKCKLLGEHNLENILAVLTICKQLKLNLNKVVNIIYQFTGLSHRLEFFKNSNNTDFYNDSKATNANSTIMAIKSLKQKYKTITLLLGGEKKLEDYSELLNLINFIKIKVIVFGESKEFFAKKINNVKIANNLKDAANLAKNIKCECVVLSPACASFDEFKNFEERGDTYKKIINKQ